MDPLLAEFLHIVTRSIEVIGILVICGGILVAAVNYTLSSRDIPAYHRARATLGRGILLGLELLVAADIIQTVAVEPTLDSVLVLGGIVLIRTFLSLSLEVEITGRWPWTQSRPRNPHE
ncbi:membrane protein [Devosia pacifica]|uniref:Membrane protein n=1 Tax=Devosia pacifica TaxID=1335967 RepID=A0A918SDS9_9HYPH|nr:DUF1622 domain-containing protein [Devosia pacifica]GHA37105.1 membrane protein [Devosia pacifica]